jgi:hypothetical protein
MTALIVLPGPAMPRTSADTSSSRVTFCVGLCADSWLCGSSSKHRSGRRESPVVSVSRLPRMPSPVSPEALATLPAVGTIPSDRSVHPFGQLGGGGTVGSTTRSLPHSIIVGSPSHICPAARFAIPPKQFAGWLISGKSAAYSGKNRMYVLIAASESSALPWFAPIRNTYRRCA